MQRDLRKCLKADRVGMGWVQILGERKEKRTGDLRFLFWCNLVEFLIDKYQP